MPFHSLPFTRKQNWLFPAMLPGLLRAGLLAQPIGAFPSSLTLNSGSCLAGEFNIRYSIFDIQHSIFNIRHSIFSRGLTATGIAPDSNRIPF
jgi:hypothetical protein